MNEKPGHKGHLSFYALPLEKQGQEVYLTPLFPLVLEAYAEPPRPAVKLLAVEPQESAQGIRVPAQGPEVFEDVVALQAILEGREGLSRRRFFRKSVCVPGSAVTP